jgi:arylformamidase
MPLYDITIPIRESLAVWPGDTPYRFELAWSMDAGQTVNVGAVTTTVHVGTHADAPFHFLPDGEGAGEMDPSAFVGPAVVVDVAGADPIGWDRLESVDFMRAPRVLLRTGAWIDHAVFPERIPILAPDIPARLAERGVVMVGLDVPSVDAIDSTDLPLHHALARANIRILESLDLRGVPPGVYTLSALPLRLMGADGSPVRAVLF